MKKLPVALLSAALWIAVAVLLLIALELVLRQTPLRGFALALQAPPQYIESSTPVSNYRIAPNVATSTYYFEDGSFSVWSNDYGCFDEPFATSTSPFIYLAGDSFTWGFAPFASTWGSIIEHDTGLRVMKCGVPGYGTRQEYTKALQDLSIVGDPSVIVVGYHPNDAGDDTWLVNPAFASPNKTHLNRYTCDDRGPVLFSWRCWLYLHSVLYNVVAYTASTHAGSARTSVEDLLFPPLLSNSFINGTGAKRNTSWMPVLTSENEESIRLFAQLARARSAKLLFVLTPSKQDAVYGVTSAPEALRSFLDSEGIAYFDLHPAFAALDRPTRLGLYWPRDLHWNTEGNRFVGRLVSGYLLEHKI